MSKVQISLYYFAKSQADKAMARKDRDAAMRAALVASMVKTAKGTANGSNHNA